MAWLVNPSERKVIKKEFNPQKPASSTVWEGETDTWNPQRRWNYTEDANCTEEESKNRDSTSGKQQGEAGEGTCNIKLNFSP